VTLTKIKPLFRVESVKTNCAVIMCKIVHPQTEPRSVKKNRSEPSFRRWCSIDLHWLRPLAGDNTGVYYSLQGLCSVYSQSLC